LDSKTACSANGIHTCVVNSDEQPMTVESLPILAQKKQHLLHNGAFCQLWIGNTISWAGDQFYLVALPWLVLSLTGSSIVLASIVMLGTIPRAALMLLGGAVTDRASPRRILMLTALVRSALVTAGAALLFLGNLHRWELYVLALGFGVADAFSYPAGSAILPAVVEPEQLAAANSISQSTEQIMTFLAPGPAGLFIRAFGSAWALLLDGISFLAIIPALSRLPDPLPNTTAPENGMMRSIADGLHYVSADASLRSLVLIIAVLNFALAGPITVGLAVIAKHQFGTASAFGLLISSFAAGGLIGMLCAGLVRLRRRGYTLLLASTVIGLCAASIGFLNRIATIAPDLILMSGAAAFLSIQLIAWLQQRVERVMMGRVMSVLMFASVGLTPVSLALAGFTLQVSVSGTFFLAGAMVLLVTLLAASYRAVRAID
jgi:hypothetical protein